MATLTSYKLNTYDDIRSSGIGKLRSNYSSSGLAIRQKTQINKINTIDEMIRASVMNPDQLLTIDVLAEGSITNRN